MGHISLRAAAARVAEEKEPFWWRKVERKKLTLDEAQIQSPEDVRLQPDETDGDVEVYYASSVLDAVFGPDRWADKGSYVPYEVEGEAVSRWAEANGAVTYERPKEEFDVGEAAGLARKGGKGRVVVDNLS